MDNQLNDPRAVKEAPMMNAVQRLESRVHGVAELLNDLENRLSPVLVPQPQGTREGTVSPSANAPLTTVLNGLAEKLDVVMSEIKDIRSRLEL